ncbi:hypothetical protein QUF72_19505 [Desulfobacterales bacterium HSG2]|nr:hypothetical protein [Desulfobacterales bacterium HSG2]
MYPLQNSTDQDMVNESSWANVLIASLDESPHCDGRALFFSRATVYHTLVTDPELGKRIERECLAESLKQLDSPGKKRMFLKSCSESDSEFWLTDIIPYYIELGFFQNFPSRMGFAIPPDIPMKCCGRDCKFRPA